MRVPSVLLPVVEACGLVVKDCTLVSGGDINQSFCLQTADSKFFLKLNDASRFPEMFSREASGLLALGQTGCLEVPSVVQSGICMGMQFLLMEWLERARPNNHFWQSFGTGLACLHKRHSNDFGWVHDNYIGSLIQRNGWRKSWSEFYTDMRIMPLVVQLVERGNFSSSDLHLAEEWCSKLGNIFPAEPPALLHGDFWSGNFLASGQGFAVVYDPAVYYGHREMDIAMSKLFGGFEPGFYDAYHDQYPLEKDWQSRLPYAQLYPLLVHAVLFGGSYVHQCRKTMTLA